MSKMVGCRLPLDLAEMFEVHCLEAGKTSAEIIRGLIDDMLYPSRADLDSPEQLYGVKATEQIVELVNAQVKEQLKDQLGDLVDEHLELVQVDRALTEAEKEFFNKSLAALGSNLTDIKTGVNKLVQVINNNSEVSNESFKRVSRLFLYLDAHAHGPAGGVVGPKAAEFNKEVELAKKRVGELEPDTIELEPDTIELDPIIIKGKTSKPGYKYLEYLNLSVKES